MDDFNHSPEPNNNKHHKQYDLLKLTKEYSFLRTMNGFLSNKDLMLKKYQMK